MLALMTTLILACNGSGTAVKPDVKSVQGSGDVNGSYNYGQGNFTGSQSYEGTVYGTRERGYEDQVDVEIDGDSGRIRLPRVTLPVVHGGSGGWFLLKDVTVTDRAIDAKAAVNIVNIPKVHIDRVTGTISINGRDGDYSGKCAAVDPNATKQF